MAKKYLKNSEGIVRAVTSDNLGLEKPLLNENYNIEVHNRNMDKIDNAIQEVKGEIDGLELVASKVAMANGTSVEDAVSTNKSNISSLQTKVDNGQNYKLTDDNGIAFNISNQNINDIRGSGKIFHGENIINSPRQEVATWWTIESYVGSDYGHQIATAWHSDERYIRRCNNNTWTSWREL